MKTSGPNKKKEKHMNDNDVIFTVVKPDQDKHGSGTKIARIRVLFSFISKLRNVDYYDDPYVLQMILPDEPDDHLWFRDNVLRYVDIDNGGTTGIIEAKADKLIETYHLKDPEGVYNIGLGTLIFNVGEMYMKSSKWKVNDGKE